MRILAGQDEDFQGNLQLSSGIKVGYLQQEPKLDMEATVLGNIEPALASTKSMLSEFEEVRFMLKHMQRAAHAGKGLCSSQN